MGGGEFVIAIMLYYILIYLIKRFALKYITNIILLIGIVSVVVYYFWFPYKYETGPKGLYGVSTLYRWIPYTAFMLMGAWIGLTKDKIKVHKVWDVTCMIFCLGIFYGIQFLAKKFPAVAPYQIITLLPLFGLVYYIYKICNFDYWNKLMSPKRAYDVIMAVSGLCLESYLIQGYLFTTKMNGIFPLNLPIMVIIVLLTSFICKCLSRLFVQTFSDNEYNWKEIIKLY